ncbi:hypothetical protein CI109_107289 [Kwoniella shandongensis]|uniref:Uncharacterized protein n=1 Tax=Kwoniella shandongensis TaxID=1734106 RepID=A0A5M6C3A3_9TREE|nr:uncharacterized protein CI109_002573 [Kwoniella shandongensis]KAA5529231.1 hypothetical protein CI109_002573 [Kwoniella shandongensis]
MSNPCPWVIRQPHHSPERPLLERDVTSPIFPRTRSNPIDLISPPPPMTSSSYQSEVSAMSDISDSLQPSSPPLLTSTSTITTAYSVRTPVPTNNSSVTVVPADPDYVEPGIPETLLVPNNGLIRVKSFPHNADLLGNSSESSGSRSTLSSTPTDNELPDEGPMEIDTLHGQTSDHTEPETVRPRPGPARGTLTQILRNIDSDESLTTASSHTQRPTSTSHSSSFSPWGDTVPHDASSTDQPVMGRRRWNLSAQQELYNDSPGTNHLGLFAQSNNQIPSHDRLSTAGRVGENNARGSGHRSNERAILRAPSDHTAAPVPIRGASRAHILAAGPHRLSAIAAFPPSGSSPRVASDIRSLPSPASDVGTAGSPGALERRIDNIEARLDRARQRNQRSPTSSPGPSAHFHDSYRSRPSASHPYDLASLATRSRPSAQAEEANRRTVSGRDRSRPSWLDASSEPTVPRPRPASMFGWDPNPIAAGEPSTQRQSFYGSTLPVQGDDGGLEVRRYLRERADALDAPRHPSHRPSSYWHYRPPSPIDFSSTTDGRTLSQLRTEMENRRMDNGAARLLHNLGMDVDEPLSEHGDVLRPPNRRWLSTDEGRRAQDREAERSRPIAIEHPIGTWNRDVNEAIGRRLSQPRPQASSLSRRLREQLGTDWEDTRILDSTSTVGTDQPNVPPPPADRSLWGEVANRPLPPDPDDAPNPPSQFYGYRPAVNPIDDYAAFMERRARARFMRGDADSILTRHLLNQTAIDTPRFGRDTRHDLENFSSDGPGIFSLLGPPPPPLRRYHAPLTHLQLTGDMSAEDRAKVVEMVARGVTRLPSGPRKKAAESTLETVPWGGLGDREGMPKDEYCSVCHDEYNDEDSIAVTPCKHMYHKDCLDTWLNTPNTSSCPMCRRDLAVLACLIKMVPSKAKEDALPLWGAP